MDKVKEKMEDLLKFEMTPNNVNVVKKFVGKLQLDNVKPQTILNNVESIAFVIRKVAAQGKDFKDYTDEEVILFIQALNEHTYQGKSKDKPIKKLSEATKQYHKLTFRRLLETAGQYELAKSIKIKNVRQEKMPDTILSDADVNLMLSKARGFRESSVVATLYESGCRCGELIGCLIKDLSFVGNTARLKVTGKTGTRISTLVFSVPYLRKWLEIHPRRNDPDAPLWTLEKATANGKDAAITHGALTAIVKELGASAGIKKRCNLHAFRHARATRLANKFTEQQMKKMLGWSASSNMASVYTHLSNKDIEDATLQLYGMKTAGDVKAITVRQCPHCGQVLSQNSTYCDACNNTIE